MEPYEIEVLLVDFSRDCMFRLTNFTVFGITTGFLCLKTSFSPFINILRTCLKLEKYEKKIMLSLNLLKSLLDRDCHWELLTLNLYILFKEGLQVMIGGFCKVKQMPKLFLKLNQMKKLSNSKNTLVSFNVASRLAVSSQSTLYNFTSTSFMNAPDIQLKEAV